MHWKWLSEFRDFALKGNVVDLAVGVIIGAAFGKIVSALVENVLMPPIGFLLKGVDFKDLAINMGTAQTPVLIKYGVFLQTLIDFIIIALVLFLLWLYATACAFLIGGEVAETYDLAKKQRKQRAILT